MKRGPDPRDPPGLGGDHPGFGPRRPLSRARRNRDRRAAAARGSRGRPRDCISRRGRRRSTRRWCGIATIGAAPATNAAARPQQGGYRAARQPLARAGDPRRTSPVRRLLRCRRENWPSASSSCGGGAGVSTRFGWKPRPGRSRSRPRSRRDSQGERKLPRARQAGRVLERWGCRPRRAARPNPKRRDQA